MGTIDFDRIRVLVEELDEAVPRDGAVVVHDLDVFLDAKYGNIIGDDDCLNEYLPGLANRRGILRFGIEHLLAAVARLDEDEKYFARAETGYLSNRCMGYSYVVDEEAERLKYVEFDGAAKSGGKTHGFFVRALVMIILLVLLAYLVLGIGSTLWLDPLDFQLF